MRPDFLINQRTGDNGVVYIVTPGTTEALNWMLARVTKEERRNLSAMLSPDRLAEFKSEAALARMQISEPKASPQP